MLHVFTQEIWENGIQVTLNMVHQHPGPDVGPDVWGGAVGDSIGTAQAASHLALSPGCRRVPAATGPATFIKDLKFTTKNETHPN